MKAQRSQRKSPKSKTARPYSRPEIHSEPVTEKQGLETCPPVDEASGCLPAAG